MAEESGARSRLKRRLAWAWLVLLAGGVALGKLAEIGPLVWIETWWAVETGSLLNAGLLLLLLILGWPALWVLLDAADRAEQAAATGHAGLRRHAGRSALFLIAFAGSPLAMAGVAALLLAGLPADEAPPVPLTAEALAQGVAAARRVIVTGAPVERARAAFMQNGRGTAYRWAYTGFRPGATRAATRAEPAGAPPIALFVERSERTSWPPRIRERMPQQETIDGHIVENGLPPYARIVLERAGVRIASPHYLIRDDAARGGQYRMLIHLGLVLAAMTGAVALLVWLIGALPIRLR